MSLDTRVCARVGTLDIDVQLQAAEGETVAILGPNGAGKSTVLQALAGLRPLDEGHVRLDGVTLDEPAAGIFVEPEDRPIGVVFQDYLLFPYLSALDNVAFGLRSRGARKADARQIAQDWLERVGLQGRAAQKPRTLSGGEGQRVALARALATEPRLLLLDEPLAALDVGARSEIRRELRTHLGSFGGTRIVVTHDPIDAATLADRLVVVEAGVVSHAGTFDDISAHPRSRYVAELVGLNLFHGRADAGTVTIDGTAATLTIADRTVRGDVYAVISPRAVAVHAREPTGSPRNRWHGTVTDVYALADRMRVRVDGEISIVADVTRDAARELGLAPGVPVWTATKATEIDVSPK
jgi:molybdate transport system ATP-binding protein